MQMPDRFLKTVNICVYEYVAAFSFWLSERRHRESEAAAHIPYELILGDYIYLICFSTQVILNAWIRECGWF